VAAGTSPQEQAAQSERTPAQGRLGAAVEADIREVLEGAQA
jgi:hypothetical protein